MIILKEWIFTEINQRATSQCSSKMTRSHKENRKLICACCGVRKTNCLDLSVKRNILEIYIEKINPSYDVQNIVMPTGVCQFLIYDKICFDAGCKGVIPYQIGPPLEVTIFNFYKNWHTDWYILQDIWDSFSDLIDHWMLKYEDDIFLLFAPTTNVCVVITFLFL